jgi:ribosomal protein L11 methylase PrmA
MVPAQALTNRRDGASFRDGKGSVHHVDGKVLRALSPLGMTNWRAFSAHSLSTELMAEGVLVATREATGEFAWHDTALVLEHEPLRFISYAFEWPFSLLKRAALLHLNLLTRLIPAGFILADATPSNVMFHGIRPVFIDTGSIVPYRPGDAWAGFKQFLETMLYPLLVTAHKGIPYNAWLRGAGEDGLPVDQVARLFGWRDLLKPGVLGHVKLTSAIERLTNKSLDVTPDDVRQAGISTSLLLRSVTRIERVVARLEPKRTFAKWADYDAEAGYGTPGQERKRSAVDAEAGRLLTRDAMVWDVGCNTGDYSFLVANRSQLVVAMEEQPIVADAAAQRASSSGIDNVLPLVVDFANPSPAQGWRGQERRTLGQRGVPDLILALAVWHHLILTKNLPADQVLGELAQLGRRCLLEYIAPADPLANRLARNAGDGRNELPTPELFDRMVTRHFSVDGAIPLTDSRTLYVLDSKERAFTE